MSGNQTLLFLTTILHGVVARYQVEHLERRAVSDEIQRKRSLGGIRSFRKLVALIEAGDGDKAEAHWRLHVINANKSWLEPDQADSLIDVLD